MWNDERVALLKKLWADGMSARVIANRLGNVTRNSVISKVHRLGLPQRATRVGGRRQKRPEAPSAKAKPFVISPAQRQRPPPLPVEPYVEKPAPYEPPLSQQVAKDDLEAHHCKFPIGDPRDAAFRHCGGRRVIGTPYCDQHCRIAFAPLRVPAGVAAAATRFRAGWRNAPYPSHPSQKQDSAASGLPEPEKEDA